MRKRTFLWPFVALCLTVAPGTGFGDIVFAQTQPASAGSSQAVSPAPAAEQQGEQEPESDEPAPAVVELKISGSPLIVTLYEATRATKEKQILEKLEVARKLLEQNVDIQATDSFGRTALHWAVFGASYSIKPSVIAAYAKITDLLVSRGVDINHQDKYNDTALDYLTVFAES